ncbi:MAG: type I-U CRISPR-associated helicase/endonuclease Cas3 [Variibacter sp.]|nr:type I-U CRISPR-associated helicase/endonuclease Cas3 [Variibacter sp.]
MTAASDRHQEYFEQGFRALTGQSPFGWQRRLFAAHFVRGEVPAALDIPTGLGKTSVITVWLLALAWQAECAQAKQAEAAHERGEAAPNAARGGILLPRRLVYVVDRRTVVDQATDIAAQLRRRLRGEENDKLTPAGVDVLIRVRDALSELCIDGDDDASPLAISTLRGERADNREWQADPARPAIIVGTVDMIGSRLLFSGYGVSRRMRPFHAGLLGQDTLLVHDEAHLSRPFGTLIRDIAEHQRQQKAPRPLRVMELSATQRERAGDHTPFTLTDEDRTEAEVAKRLRASKRLHFVDSMEDKSAALAKVVELALRYKDQCQRVLVYVRRPGDAKEISDRLAKAVGEDRVSLLTGTIRGYERDKLTETAIFKGFRAAPDRTPPEATQYLIATSAGEVGVDLDADHAVCDLSTLDSMIQRLGRVNRLGGGEADIHVVEWPKKERKGDDDSDRDKPLASAKEALASLPKRDGAHDASPESLRALADRTEAFAPTPRTVPITDILLDNWALTRVKDLPGRPMPERWLHGVEAGEPDLYVAWREEVSELAACLRGESRNSIGLLKQLYDKHPILARERLRGRLSEVKEELKRLARRKPKDGAPDEPIRAVLLPVSGDPVIDTLDDLLDKQAPRLPNATIVLPPAAGGLDERGMLDAAAAPEASRRYDVADEPVEGAVQRARAWLAWREDEGRWAARWLGRDDDGNLDAAVATAENFTAAVKAVRERAAPLVEKEVLELENEEGERVGALVLFGSPRSTELAQDNPGAAAGRRPLEDHLADVRAAADVIVTRLAPLVTDAAEAARIADAVMLAAQYHDRGKNRDPWQADIGNPRPRKNDAGWEPLAKSDRRGFVSRLSGAYRHEFGSLREAAEDPSVRAHPERDLILHLIAAHHGWARPHFEPDQWDIADGVTEDENAALAAETMRRFARLQRRFGHWGLAWLESLVRAADYAASGRLAANGASASPAPRAPANAAAKESAA